MGKRYKGNLCFLNFESTDFHPQWPCSQCLPQLRGGRSKALTLTTFTTASSSKYQKPPQDLQEDFTSGAGFQELLCLVPLKSHMPYLLLLSRKRASEHTSRTEVTEVCINKAQCMLTFLVTWTEPSSPTRQPRADGIWCEQLARRRCLSQSQAIAFKDVQLS